MGMERSVASSTAPIVARASRPSHIYRDTYSLILGRNRTIVIGKEKEREGGEGGRTLLSGFHLLVLVTSFSAVCVSSLQLF